MILAWGPPEIAEHILAKQTYIRHTRNTITSAKAMRRELARARECGYALDDEEEELGVRCIAVPVFHPNGQFVAGLSVTGTTTQIPLEAIDGLAQKLRQTAAGIFHGLGA